MLFIACAISSLMMYSCSDEQIVENNNLDYTTATRAIINEEEALTCGTPAPAPPSWMLSRATNSSHTEIDITKRYEFRVHVYIINSSTQSYPIEYANSIISYLNNYYANSGISFILEGADKIVSEEYTKANYITAMNIYNLMHKSNAINIYMIAGSSLGVAGVAGNIPSNYFLVQSSYALKPTLPHEMGHCLGLYHTHHGTSDNEPSNDGKELVDGSNSLTAGDYIVDTPADPCLWSADGTRYIGTITDANGDYYNPDPTNLMSYSSIRTNFTTAQIVRMHDAIQNTTLLRMACTIKNLEIEGPTYLGSSATYSIDCEENYDVDWTVVCETFTKLNSAATSTETSHYSGHSFTLNNKDVNATSQRYTITATITSPNAQVNTITKKVYHVLPSANTGLLRWGSDNPSGNYNGELDLDGYTSPSNPVKIQRGGTLNFYYSDASGGYSYQHPDYYTFTLIDNYGIFTKATNAPHIFTCNRDAEVGTTSLVLFVGINGISKSIAFTVQILDADVYLKTENDSLSIY